jgi:hypothetical protein
MGQRENNAAKGEGYKEPVVAAVGLCHSFYRNRWTMALCTRPKASMMTKVADPP